MKKIILILWLLFIPITLWDFKTSIEVYNKLNWLNILNKSEIKDIHSKIKSEKDCNNKAVANINITHWYIERINSIYIRYCTTKEYRYLLLHEIGHYVQIKWIEIPRISTTKYWEQNDQENYAESFSQLYY